MSKNMMLKINSFALSAFRDTADKDYLHARMAYDAQLSQQFLWSSLHALEKYAKCILILTRVPKSDVKNGHSVTPYLELLKSKIKVQLSEQTTKFIQRLENGGASDRYFNLSWYIRGPELTKLDRAVWELRRYCNSGLYIYHDDGTVTVNEIVYDSIKSFERPLRQNTYILGGWLEKVLADKSHAARKSLVLSNLYYTTSNRKTASVKSGFSAGNSLLSLYPEIVDEVAKYVLIPKEIKNMYKRQ